MLQIERQILTHQSSFSEEQSQYPKILNVVHVCFKTRTSFEIMIWGRFVQQGIVM